MNDQRSVDDINRRNMRVLATCAGLVVAMVGLAYASVPLYRVFCQVTGFGGTTQVATVAPDAILEREITIRFDANISSELPWDFAPEQVSQTLRIGETGLAFYISENFANAASTGVASFNVTPPDAGRYFNKIECFCFTEQTLEAGERVRMPVYYYVDPAIADVERFDDLGTITLSYTFYPGGPVAPATQDHVAIDTNLGQRNP